MMRLSIFTAAAAFVTLGTVGATAAPSGAMTVYKDPNCGCCGGWIDYVRAAGFEIEIRDTTSMHDVKVRLGVPDELLSCHTAEIDGYVVEGHVPLPAIEAVLKQRPKVTGLAVPGMPAGSPGMDAPGMASEPYEVILFADGARQPLWTFLGSERQER